MKQISYIVPVYNAEKYLASCIESILAQHSEQIELILVDDGSSDQSPQICDAYAEQDPRVTVIHQANGGVSSARNRGLDIACGTYIRFVDADDMICENDELALVQNSTADWITGGILVVDANGRIIENRSTQSRACRADALLCDMEHAKKKITFHSSCNHFYRRALIEQASLRFDLAVSLGEDFLFNIAYFDLCTELVYISESIYRYYKRENASLTGIFRADEFVRRKRMDAALLSLYEGRGIAEQSKEKTELMIGEIAFTSVLKIRYPHPPRAYRDKMVFLDQMLGSEYYTAILRYLSSDRCIRKGRRIERLLWKYRRKRMLYLFEAWKYALTKR